MSFLSLLGNKYKYYFYKAEVDKPRGFQYSIVLMGIFLIAVVELGFSTTDKAILVFILLSLFLAIFPYVFPKDKNT